MTSPTARQLEVAVVMAVAAEAPLALVCIWVARNSERSVDWPARIAARRPAKSQR
jgi:hypothetical protein